MRTALTIAGSDSSGGAGVQADLKTMIANGVYGMSVITAITAQNTLGIRSVLEVPAGIVKDQMDAVFTDIFPDSVKIGMLGSKAVTVAVEERIRHYGAGKVVIDPVMISTSNTRLLDGDAVTALRDELFPLAALITPNIPEAWALMKDIPCEAALSEHIANCPSSEAIENAAGLLGDRYGCPVLIKGGHSDAAEGSVSCCDDVLYSDGQIKWYRSPRIANNNTHGTGCTLSSAICSNLARGLSLDESVAAAKDYVSLAIASNLDIGHGKGPLNHACNIVTK